MCSSYKKCSEMLASCERRREAGVSDSVHSSGRLVEVESATSDMAGSTKTKGSDPGLGGPGEAIRTCRAGIAIPLSLSSMCRRR